MTMVRQHRVEPFEVDGITIILGCENDGPELEELIASDDPGKIYAHLDRGSQEEWPLLRIGKSESDYAKEAPTQANRITEHVSVALATRIGVCLSSEKGPMDRVSVCMSLPEFDVAYELRSKEELDALISMLTRKRFTLWPGK